MKIPTKFYKGDNAPTVRTVGELKARLAELPDDLPVRVPFCDEPQVVVFNHGLPSVHVTIQEPN